MYLTYLSQVIFLLYSYFPAERRTEDAHQIYLHQQQQFFRRENSDVQRCPFSRHCTERDVKHSPEGVLCFSSNVKATNFSLVLGTSELLWREWRRSEQICNIVLHYRRRVSLINYDRRSSLSLFTKTAPSSPCRKRVQPTATPGVLGHRDFQAS